MIAFELQSQGIADLRAKAAEIGQAGPMLKVGGRALAEKLKDHFAERDSSHANKLGGKRTHFWGDVRRAVQNPVVETDSVSVSVNHLGLAQRYFGGTILPVIAKFLALPARAEAYGKTPREFHDLHFQPTSRGGALVQNLQTSLKRGKKAGENIFKSGGERGGLVMFWLVKEVHQDADPSVLPPETEMLAAVESSMGNYLARKLASRN